VPIQVSVVLISPSGEVLQAQPWNKAAAIKMAIKPSDHLTFYSRTAIDKQDKLPLAIIALLMTGTAFVKNRKRQLANN
jgi:apolipoprotein N-acyltransferase